LGQGIKFRPFFLYGSLTIKFYFLGITLILFVGNMKTRDVFLCDAILKKRSLFRLDVYQRKSNVDHNYILMMVVKAIILFSNVSNQPTNKKHREIETFYIVWGEI